MDECEARFAVVEGHASDHIIVNDLDGLLTYVSPSASTVLGYQPEDLVGTQARDLIHPDDVRHVEETAAAQFAGQPVEPVEYRARHRDGSWRAFHPNITPLLAETPAPGARTNAPRRHQ